MGPPLVVLLRASGGCPHRCAINLAQPAARPSISLPLCCGLLVLDLLFLKCGLLIAHHASHLGLGITELLLQETLICLGYLFGHAIDRA